NLHIPPPPASVADWPVIGKSLHEAWTLASHNLTDLIDRYPSGTMNVVTWLGTTAGRMSFQFFQFLCSILFAGILLMYNREARNFSASFFQKILSDRGRDFSAIAEKTVRNVARGIIGVAFIQAVALGAGLYIAGVPFAGPLSLLCLVLCIVQLGTFLVAIPVIIYAFTAMSTAGAIVLTLWCVVVMFSDNILKPVFLSKGAPVPTAVIFLGSIGGFLLSGIIGLFIGAVILSLGYRLFISWVQIEKTEGAD
ncbi:MAG: AI-2E family transporter, partial [Bacteroidota bacterium]